MSKCTNCGANFVIVTEAPPPPSICKACQIQRLQFQKANLWKALSDLVGVSSKAELKEMAQLLRDLPGNEHTRAVSINAVHALLDTYPNEQS